MSHDPFDFLGGENDEFFSIPKLKNDPSPQPPPKPYTPKDSQSHTPNEELNSASKERENNAHEGREKAFAVNETHKEKLDDNAELPPVKTKALLKERNASPFLRMLRTQILSTAGDTFFSVALAGTIFFAQEPTEARWRVALYLALTVAPFILAAPFIGPVLDRVTGGRRWSLFGAAAGRAVLAFVIMRDLNSIWFYPEVFAMLVLGKVHLISKAAVVPSTVQRSVPLVKVNSKLSLYAVIAAAVAAPLGLALGMLSPQIPLGLAVVAFMMAAWQIRYLPDVRVAYVPESPEGLMELAGLPIKFATNALTFTRALLGFFIFFAAFSVKNADRPLWWLGVIATAAQIGYFVGVISAPQLGKRVHEQQTITIALGVMTVTSTLAFLLLAFDVLGPITSLLAVAGFAFMLGACASAAKLSFDSLVQHDAPDANRGRMFANFETRFQMSWALGALVAVIIPFPDTVALALVAFLTAVGFGGYMLGRRLVKLDEEKTDLSLRGKN